MTEETNPASQPAAAPEKVGFFRGLWLIWSAVAEVLAYFFVTDETKKKR